MSEIIQPIKENIESNNKRICYVFMTGQYDIAWSSLHFYHDMVIKIKKILIENNAQVLDIKTFRIMVDTNDIEYIYILDPALIVKNINNLHLFLSLKYILVIGENLDEKNNTFIGWDGKSLRSLKFSPESYLYKVIENAHKITYQNDKIRDLILRIKNSSENVSFFPIDGYTPDCIIENKNNYPDIDLLIYGGLVYERRINVVRKLLTTVTASRKIVICNNVFEINDLINRSKIIMHINSVDGCYHVPYAKIMKLLANNKIVFVEETEELMRSELLNYVHTFNIYDQAVKVPSYCKIAEYLIKNYASIQGTLNDKNPAALIKEKYNFETNVKNIFIQNSTNAA